jgi:hypothetical protein
MDFNQSSGESEPYLLLGFSANPAGKNTHYDHSTASVQGWCDPTFLKAAIYQPYLDSIGYQTHSG